MVPAKAPALRASFSLTMLTAAKPTCADFAAARACATAALVTRDAGRVDHDDRDPREVQCACDGGLVGWADTTLGFGAGFVRRLRRRVRGLGGCVGGGLRGALAHRRRGSPRACPRTTGFEQRAGFPGRRPQEPRRQQGIRMGGEIVRDTSLLSARSRGSFTLKKVGLPTLAESRRGPIRNGRFASTCTVQGPLTVRGIATSR